MAFVPNNQSTLRRDFDDIFSLVDLVTASLDQLKRECPSLAERIMARATEIDLILNAAQASQPGQEIGVSTAHDGGNFVVAVEDQGQGIAPDHLTKVFDPFFTTKPVGEGTGLGLSITHQIIQAHHGDIRIDRTPGNGTRVRLRLPLSSGK